MASEKIKQIFADAGSISELTGIPVQTVREMTRSGILPGKKVGGKWIYRISAVFDVLDADNSKNIVDGPETCHTFDSTERVPLNQGGMQ